MRIIHTADWHLNHRLNRIAFNPFLEAAAQQVVQAARDRRADALIIAGDLFAGHEGREQLKSSIEFLKRTLRPYLDEGGTVLAISGNHDSEAFFETLRDAFDLVASVTPDADGYHAPGRVYIAPNPTVRRLRAQDGGPGAQFLLMPFPTPRAYIDGERVNYKNSAERNTSVVQKYRERLERLRTTLRSDLPTVFVGHAAVRGVSEQEYFQASDAQDVILDTTDLPDVAYGAFGHIHRAQSITGGNRFWYSGSLMPLDAGEATQEKGALFVELGRGGMVGAPERVPLVGLPALRDITIDAQDLDALETSYPDHATAIVKYRLRYDRAVHPDPFVLHKRIREVFPRWYDSEDEVAGQVITGRTSGDDLYSIADLPGSVTRYLSEEAGWDAGEDRDGVIALAESLLKDESLIDSLYGRK